MDQLYENQTADSEFEDTKSDVEIGEPEVSEREAISVTDSYRDESDYEAIVAEDIKTLKSDFPELASLSDITELDNPVRYAALRDLGLTPREAYLATSKRNIRDTRSHLRAASGIHTALSRNTMSREELSVARELFSGMSDSEIQRLYKKVTSH